MNDFETEFRSRFHNAPREAKDFLADMMISAILRSDIIPEESKIEVRLMKAGREIQDTIHQVIDDFACPLPSSDPEGREVQQRIYQARKDLLEYLQLMKGGLDTFLQNVPAPDIPEKFKKAARRHD